MKFRLLLSITLLLIGLALGEVFRPFQALQSHAQSCRTFTETGKQVCGRFLEYWTQNGGLAQQGLPLSNEFSEVSDLNGQTYTVQYFERAVFEKHPENARPFDVLLSQLGTFQFKRKYPSGEPGGSQPTQPPAPPPAGEAPITFRGSQEVNTPPFRLQGGTYELTWSIDIGAESQSAFSVWLRGAGHNYSDLLVNVIVKRTDPKSGSTFVYNVPAGQYFFEAGATRANWEFTLTRK
jgi:hypothetical protein